MATIDYDSARALLNDTLALAEANLLNKSVPAVPVPIQKACLVVFESGTQAYREVLLGCVLARIQDKTVNVRLPYVNQGPTAFNGRTLDERVVNPFLHDERIPSSRGPYLSAFRRSVRFDAGTREGLRDKAGYDAFLKIITYLEKLSDDAQLLTLLQFLLYKFAQLREASHVPLSRLQRISLEQYGDFIAGLLATPSGGRFPVLLVLATFSTIKEFFHLDWTITFQGINVADTASGAGGDITITSGNQPLMAAEVTERPVDRSRVVATFNTKIAPAGIEDYLFFTKLSSLDPQARQQAHQYFSQGHEVNFLEIQDWIKMALGTMGKNGRAIFNKLLTSYVDAPDVPKALKVSWNEQIEKIVR